MLKFIYACFKAAVVVVLIAALGIGYVIYGERNLLVVKTHKLSFGADTSQALRVVQFSDTHVGEYFSLAQLERVVKKINAQQPDIVVFTGDLFDIASQSDSQERQATFRALGEIEATLGCFAIYGNRDVGGGAIRFYEESMEQVGFRVLKDETVRFAVGNKSVTLSGADDFLLGAPEPERMFEQVQENGLNLLAVHEPDAYDFYKDAPFDLAMSGHSHGGQVILPLYGPVAQTSMCETYFKGLYEIENARNARLYVSSGIGNTKVPFRFGNVPEIVRFDIAF